MPESHHSEGHASDPAPPTPPSPPKGLANVWTRAILSFFVWIPIALAVWLGTATVPLFRGLIDVLPEATRGTALALITVLMGVLGVAIQFVGHDRIKTSHLRTAFGVFLLGFVIVFFILAITFEANVVRVDVPAVGTVAYYPIGEGPRPKTCYCETDECPNGKSMGDAECIENCLTLKDAAVEGCWGRDRMSRVRTRFLVEYLLLMGISAALVGVLVLREAQKRASSGKE